MKPLCIDLFCGYGGWAKGFSDAGYRVVGFDNEPKCRKHYEANGGEFVLADVRTLDGHRFVGATVIVASPPCNEFTRLRFLRKPAPPPDMSRVAAVWRIRTESHVETVLENVEGAQRFLGPAACHRGAYYLWGDVPLLPFLRLPPKEGAVRAHNPRHQHNLGLKPERMKTWGNRNRTAHGSRLRALIPYPLARALAEACL